MTDALMILEKYLGRGVRECSSKYRFRCYKCFSSRSLSVNPNKNRCPYICNSCGVSGNLLTLIKFFNGDFKDLNGLVYQPPKVEADFSLMERVYSKLLDLSELKKSHKDYLLSRGINLNLTTTPCSKSMIVRSSDYAVTKLLDYYSPEDLLKVGLMDLNKKSTPVIEFDRIIIFYFSIDGRCNYIRTRASSPTKIRYLSPSGVPGKTFSWGWETYDKFSGYIIVTEGEFKAQAAKQTGLQCVALPGITTAQDFTANIINSLNIPVVYILFDSDSGVTPSGITKQYAIDQEAIKFSRKIKNSRVFLCRLPLLEKSKMDIDTYVNILGNEARDGLISILNSGRDITNL